MERVSEENALEYLDMGNKGSESVSTNFCQLAVKKNSFGVFNHYFRYSREPAEMIIT